MDVRIGIAETQREIALEMGEDTSADQVKAQVEAAVAAGTGLLWLTDKKGRQTAFPIERLAYVQIGSAETEPRIGFG